MKKLTNEINIRNFIIGAAVPAILMCFGSITTPAQTTCMSAEAILKLKQKDAITEPEAVKQRDCWVAKLKNGEKKMAGAFLYLAHLGDYSPTNPPPNYADVDLTNANLFGADLYGAVMDRAILNGADMTSVRLRSASLNATALRGATLISADLSGAFLFASDFTNADLRGADLTDCGLSEFNETDTKNKAAKLIPDWAQMSTYEKTKLVLKVKADIKRMENVRLTGAKINSGPIDIPASTEKIRATIGTSAAFWKARGGVVVD